MEPNGDGGCDVSRGIFSPEELAELEAFDREIEDEDAPLTLEEWRESMRRDRGLEGPPKPYSDERRAQQREQSKAYRETHLEQSRASHRAWYERNRGYAQAWQRDYYRRRNADRIAAVSRLRAAHPDAPQELRAIRELLGLSRSALGEELGRHENTVRNWETGRTRIPLAALEWLEAQRNES